MTLFHIQFTLTSFKKADQILDHVLIFINDSLHDALTLLLTCTNQSKSLNSNIAYLFMPCSRGNTQYEKAYKYGGGGGGGGWWFSDSEGHVKACLLS